MAITVAVSIWAASTVAAGVAMALPWAFSKTQIDPAFGSGPLATVAQDLLSLAISSRWRRSCSPDGVDLRKLAGMRGSSWDRR